MSAACEQLVEAASGGVAPALRAVDCVANEMTASAFGRLFSSGGAMGYVLTILLTLYIAFFAISLLTGRSSLRISALTPRMLTLGFVLVFATSWIAYQGVMWNLALGGPDWIASVLMGTRGSATQIFADRIDIIFAAITQVAEETSNGGGAANGAAGAAQGMFSPQSVMWLGALMLLLGTVGILLTARIALAVLLALGPIFVVMALFSGTRGLTAGWLRGVVLTALTPLFVVLGGGITIELLVPIIRALSSNLTEIDGRAAMALFLVAAVHLALMVMVFKVVGTMVAGWQVFGLARSERPSESNAAASAASYYAAQPNQISPTTNGQSAAASSRRSIAPAVAANPGGVASGGSGEGASRSGDRRTVVTQVSGGGIEPLAPRSASRTRGIGSRFRSASNDTGRGPAKEIKR
ncbi:type VI secretion protein [Novosphingobium sp. PC22D]|uniref:type IV secretion system protein n=1 Tax=Novosphingobium sp. PC22D TaxID=1962403 RepID=UPI000BF002C4|nr:type IV secretion system protein [Novosphingobium sp. PC22D]PEQ12745.1 type VI secretion protein [Novosphingobium sp. PC22D]